MKRALRKQAYKYKVEKLQQERQRFELKCDNAVQVIANEHQDFVHQIQKQVNLAHRRLQDLLFECTGELHKSVMRARTRVEFHQNRVDEMVQQYRQNFAWKRFIHIFQRDCLNNVVLTDVLPSIAIDSATYRDSQSSMVRENSVLRPQLETRPLWRPRREQRRQEKYEH